MRILRLHIENFGRLYNVDMEFAEGLNRICRENGWGKSTLAAFIKAMFYGLPYTTKRSLQENDRKHYLPWQGGAFGGSLEFQTEERAYRVERFFGAKDKDDTFELYDLQTGLDSLDYSERLGEELFGVDRAAYGRSSFLGQQDLMVSVNDSLGARLTHVEEDAGDMRNYERAVSSLEDKMKYFQKTGGRGQIGKLEEERRIVREELAGCRQQEDEMEEWNSVLSSRRALADDVRDSMENIMRTLRSVQEQKQTEAKRAQYELLKRQAEEKQRELQQTAAALAEYTDTPPGEEELDRCRERIYQLDGRRQREEGADRQLKDAVSRQGDVEDARGELSSPGIWLVVLAVFLMVLGGFCMFRGIPAAGIAVLIAGAVLLVLGCLKEQSCRSKMEELERRVQESGQQVREADRALRDIQKKQDMLEKKIGELLEVEKHADTAKMEQLWKEERRKSRAYRELKQRYEEQKKEVQRSRELWFCFGENFSEEEKEQMKQSREALPDAETLEGKLEQEKARLKKLEKEQEDIRFRLKGLQEKAEQIPKLKEREAWLSEQIAEAVREHDLLGQTVRYLKLAREQFSAHYLKDMKERLDHYLTEMGTGPEGGISLDVRLQMKVQEAGAYRSLESQSTGQQDLLCFAERLAVVDVLYKDEKPPLILDDPFTNLDTVRQRRAMEVLRQLSEERQMICFTCHEDPGP